MTELLDRGAGAIAEAVCTGKVKARDVAQAAIARVEARNGGLTAIVDFDPAEARASADTVDARRKQGFDGPLVGVPYTVKDLIWVAGRRVTNGSPPSVPSAIPRSISPQAPTGPCAAEMPPEKMIQSKGSSRVPSGTTVRPWLPFTVLV